MRTGFALFLVFIVGTLVAPHVIAGATPDVHAIARAVDNHYNHLRSLQADFTETYRGNGMDRSELGTLWLKKPRKMRWEYRSPREKLFLSDGETAWFYVPGEQQARKESFKKLEDLRSPLGFLLGKTKLEKELKGLSLAVDRKPLQPQDVMLRGLPAGMQGQISEVILEITPDNRIVRIILEGTDDSTTEYQLTNQRENVTVADQRFRFEPPPGVETIEGDLGQ